jgi:hypothetical protein
VAVLAAMGEREARGIGEAGGRAVHDFGDQGQGLEGARAQVFQQEE